MGLSDGVHFTILLKFCYIQYRLWQTDGQTDTSLSQMSTL